MPKTNDPSPVQSPFTLPERVWEFLLGVLQQEQCVLFVGPQLLKHKTEGTIEQALIKHLLESSEADSPPFISKFYPGDKFFMLNMENRGDMSRWTFMRQYKEFFTQASDDFAPALDTLGKIAELPFSTIISLNPDDLLTKAFAGRFNYHTDFYNKKKPPQAYQRGTKEEPLIYYMRGEMNHDESMIITHSDLFDYLESIFAEQSMDHAFKEDLKNAKSFIFLGLPLEEWYMQLLLRVLNLHAVSTNIIALKTFPEERAFLKNVYEDVYNIEFHPYHGQEFINQLHDRCQEAGMMKQEVNPQLRSFQKDYDQLNKLITAPLVDDSLTLLDRMITDYIPAKTDADDLNQKLGTLSASYRGSYRNFLQGVVKTEDFQVTQTKTIRMLGDLSSTIHQLFHEQQ